MSYDDIKAIMKQMKEIEKQVEEANKIINSPGIKEQLKSMYPLLEEIKGIELPQGVGVSTSFFNDFIKYRSKLEGLQDISSALDYIPNAPYKLIEDMNTNYKKLLKTQKNIDKVKSQLSNLRLPSEKVLDSIASIKTTIDIYNPSEVIINELLQLSNNYQVFAKKQYEYKYKNEEIYKRAMEVADYVGNMLILSQTNTQKMIEFVDEKELQEPIESSETHSNIFSTINQHIGFVYREDLEVNVNQAINESEPVKINQLGCSIIKLVCQINEYSINLMDKHIFKPTNKAILASSIIPNVIATNEDKFNKVIDNLFFLLYEGSGTANRLCQIVNKEELDALWKLKHLRRNVRHDVDHGKEKEIIKKFKQVGDIYNGFIGRPRPLHNSDWAKAQFELYQEILMMLFAILDNLDNKRNEYIS